MNILSAVLPSHARTLALVFTLLVCLPPVLPAQTTVTFSRQAFGQGQTTPVCNGFGGTPFNWPDNSNWSEQQVTATDGCNNTYITAPTNWSTLTYPNGPGFDIVIPGGSTVNLDIGTTNLNSLTVKSGGSIDLAASTITAPTYTFEGDGMIRNTGVSGGNPFIFVPGNLKKTGGTGSLVISPRVSVILQNSIVTVTSGTLVLPGIGGGTGATFNVAAGATVNLDGGGNNNSWTGSYTGTGAGTVLLTTGGRFAAGNTPPTLNFPGNLFQWTGGLILELGFFNPVVNAGVINIDGDDPKVLAHLNNLGTIFIKGTGPILGYSQSGVGGAFDLDNPAGGVVKILVDDGPTNLTFGNSGPNILGGNITNSGLFWKAAGTGKTTLSPIGVSFKNVGGTIQVDTGTLVLPGSGASTGGGLFQVATGATLDLTGGAGNLSFDGTYSSAGGGTVLFSGGTISANVGLTLNFPGNMFQWTGGAFGADNTNAKVINLAGSGAKSLGRLTNNGTINFGGTGALNIGDTLTNSSSGTITLLSDASMSNGLIKNDGLFQKTGSTGTTVFSTGSFNNTGTVAIQTGSVQFGNFINTGTVKVLGNSAQFNQYTQNSGTLQLAGTTATVVGGTMDFYGGNILGHGTIVGNVRNEIALTIGDTDGSNSAITINGTYSQFFGTVLTINVGGNTAGTYGMLNITGNAHIDGSVNINLVNGWQFRVGDTYNILTAATFDGPNVFPQFTLPAGVSGTLSTTNGAMTLTITAAPPAASLQNISTRGRVETADNVLIGGFVIAGTTDKRVIIRALGPTLTGFGVASALSNPTLTLYDPQGHPLVTNDNWRSSQEAEIIASNLAPSDDRESAIIATLAPGPYTAIVSGVSGEMGVGLVEVFDLDLSTIATSRPINVSTRGRVLTADSVMIGGFVIEGTRPRRVIIRAIGPSLTAFGVPGALADPTLTLYDPHGQPLVTNDNWKDTQQAEIVATNHAPSMDAESAIVITLNPGPYTAIVSGKNGTIGVGLVEVFDLE